MGTCMSKDKKEATVAQATCVSSSSFSSSSAQDKYLGPEGVKSTTLPPKTAVIPENQLSSTIARRSSAEEVFKEVISTDKHVVEIRLPIASPNKFKASPASATLAARAMTAIARPAEEERCAEASVDNLDLEEEQDEEREPIFACNMRNSSPPLFYSSYLSGASFSRDLAAFSRDIASLSCSPLKKSPSVNGAHDFIAAAIKAAHMSPHYAKPRYANMMMMGNDDYSTTTRSRSLPKRFYGKGAAPPPPHKRSSSRDNFRQAQLSPRVAVRREEASGEIRVSSRQAAARRLHPPPLHHPPPPVPTPTPVPAPPLSPTRRPTKKLDQRFPFPPASTCAIADDTTALRFNQENRTSSSPQPVRNHKNRIALKDMCTNSATWADTRNNGVKSSFTDDEEDDGSEAVQPVYSCSEVDNAPSDDTSFAMLRVHELIKALAEMNTENSLLSEVEESETEVEGELDLIRFAFDARLSPKKELQAQQARNLLLKEAAMDAFARPSFHSHMHPAGGLQEGKQPSPGLAALMSLRLPDAETDTSKIREVLKLLSVAESEMGSEQKLLFYDQLRMVLDSVKTQTLDSVSPSQGVIKSGSSMTDKSITARANSWPRSMKEPTQIIMSMESNSVGALNNIVNQDLSTKAVESIQTHGVLLEITTDQEMQEKLPPESSLALCERLGGAKVLELCERDVRGDTLQASENYGNLNLSRLPSLDCQNADANPCHANEENGDFIHKSLDADISTGYMVQTEQEGIKETQFDNESAEKPAFQVQNSNYSYSVLDHADSYNEIAPAKDVEVAACTLSDHTDTKVVVDGLHSASTESKGASSCRKTGSTATTTEQGEMCDVRPEIREERHDDACQVEDAPQRSMQYRETIVMMNTSSSIKGAGCELLDVGSDGSFEFRVRSTPLSSTPSTPMLSTASTPRHTNSPLTAQELAEIWEAFD